MNYQSTFTLSPTPGATGTWSFNASLMPHPINFMYVNLIDSNNPSGLESNFMNQQVAGASHKDKYASFIGMVQRWRLAYMSVTCYQDGPDLANQGTMAVCQVPVAGTSYSFASLTSVAPGSVISAWPKIEHYTTEDRPNFETAQSMPSAYFGRSREGAYAPLKLTETCQDWVSDAHRVGVTNLAYNGASPGIADMIGGNTPCFPHVNMQPCGYVYGGYVGGWVTSPMMSGDWAHLSTKNLAITTSFTFFVRCGIEMQVPPSSVLSPQLKLSPPYDAVALNTYFQIARELKDAYPSEYNDLGAMWDVISKAAKKIIPWLGMLPIPGVKGIQALANTTVAGGDALRARRQAKKKKKPAQQAPAAPKKPSPRQVTPPSKQTAT
jgi:hypothetical protein